MQITRGKINKAQKIVIYGPEGIGKTTFASQFPEPLFIDTEGSTTHLDVARLPKPETWNDILTEIQYVIDNPGVCKTLVIDTIDWAERLCTEQILRENGKNGIEDFGYGKGYIYVAEAFEKGLKLLNKVIDRGINVVLTAHCYIRKFEQPDEMGAYDRYELKLGKKTVSQTAPLVKEWSDMLLFANYKTYTVTTGDNGKKKAQGGKRVMFTSHHPCWDAKNRHDLPDELPFEFKSIAHIFANAPTQLSNAEMEQQEKARLEREIDIGIDMPESTNPQVKAESESEAETQVSDAKSEAQATLRQLMMKDKVTPGQLQKAVASKGYFPENTPYTEYPDDFVTSCLINAWEQVYNTIAEQFAAENDNMPF